MTLNPPAHICGPIGHRAPASLLQERLEWIIAARAAGHMMTDISKALGLKRNGASSIFDRAHVPARRKPPVPREVMPASRAPKDGAVLYTRTASPFSNREADVTLARAPWDGETAKPDARPETAPPRGIKSKRNGVTPEGFIALLRAECLKARMEA